MALLPLSTYNIIEIGVLVAVVAIMFIYRSQHALPPGPNPIPVIGRTGFPVANLEAFKNWAEKYPDIMTLRVWGQNVIVLNSLKATSEILVNRAASTSIRPQRVMCHELVGYAHSTSQTNNMAEHRIFRRLVATALSTRASQKYWGVEEREVRKATLHMLTAPGESTIAIKRASSEIVWNVAYGYKTESDGDAFIQNIADYMKVYQRLMRPGEFLVDILPFLKHLPAWFPGAGFKQQAVEWKETKETIHEIPFQRVKHDLAAGTATPSFAAHLIEERALDSKAGSKFDEEHIKLAAGSIYTGGNDNNTSSVQSLLVAMLMFPEVQKKAQVELDRVIGRDRLPGIDDQLDLPYCGAIVQEVLRWQPATPFALPHALDKDEEYQGYVLPKGSTVFANVWAMTRDPTLYPSPEAFIPERHLKIDAKGNLKVEAARNALAFGFGRRVCPGSHLAEAMVFAGVITILWACDLSRPVGTENFEIEYETYGVHWPKDFPIAFKERFPGAMDILRSAVYDADK